MPAGRDPPLAEKNKNMNNFLDTILEGIIIFFQTHMLRVVLILIAIFIINYFAITFIEKLIRKIIRSEKFISEEAEKKREDTLISVLSATVKVLVW